MNILLRMNYVVSARLLMVQSVFAFQRHPTYK